MMKLSLECGTIVSTYQGSFRHGKEHDANGEESNVGKKTR